MPDARISGAWARHYGTLLAGWALLTAGVVLLFLPGPGLPLLLGGLALLGREAAWARRLRKRIEAKLFRRAPVGEATPVPVGVRESGDELRRS
jgi:hypothetical protein